MRNRRAIVVCCTIGLVFGLFTFSRQTLADEPDEFRSNVHFFAESGLLADLPVNEHEQDATLLGKVPFIERLLKSNGAGKCEMIGVDFGVWLDEEDNGKVTRCRATCDSPCRSKADCSVTTKTCGDVCTCGPNCQCAKNTTAHVVRLHEQLVKTLAENAQLKARHEAIREIASQKDRFIHELVETRLESARLQARLEVAEERDQLLEQLVDTLVENAKLEARVGFIEEHKQLLVEITKLKAEKHEATVGPHAALIGALESKTENAVLKTRLAQLEQRLNEITARISKHNQHNDATTR